MVSAKIIQFSSRKYWEQQETYAHYVTVVANVQAPSKEAALALYNSGQGEMISNKVHDRYDPTEPWNVDTLAIATKSPTLWEIHQTAPRYVTTVRRVMAASHEDAEAKLRMGEGKLMNGFVGDEIPQPEFGVGLSAIVESTAKPN